jgi:OmpA-OmpF porin, OOP family
MKTIYLLAVGLALLAACKNGQKQNEDASAPATDTTATTTATPPAVAPSPAAPATTFDINSIPVSDKSTGAFPYFKLPNGYAFTDPNKYFGPGETKDYDKEYFYVHGSYWPVEGKTYKAVIRVDEKAQDKQFSKLEIVKSFDDMIAQLGGVKLNNGDKLKEGEDTKLEPDAYKNGYMHSCHDWENVHTYIIHQADKAIWVQYNLGEESTDITILETKPFKNEMSLLPASEIKQQLDEKGKAILYIQFDTDKATLQPDGEKAVAEIAKMLQQAPDLKLSINGYTDNTGTAEHNKQLSTDRATTVRNSLLAKGIDGANLQVAGFGADKPLADNSSEENKAKNRRVELVKIG